MENTPTRNKARYWTGVLYNDNMRENWEEDIADILQYPFAYCIHDKDSVLDGEHRKTHTHIVIAFPNTTTYKNAFNIFDLLSADGKKAINKCESVINIKYCYDYLIHDTDTCRKKDKFLYPKSERIEGNNFDIGNFIQVSSKDKQDITFELLKFIHNEDICNFDDFICRITDNYTSYDGTTFEVIKSNNGFFERVIKGRYLKKIGEKQ